MITFIDQRNNYKEPNFFFINTITIVFFKDSFSLSQSWGGMFVWSYLIFFLFSESRIQDFSLVVDKAVCCLAVYLVQHSDTNLNPSRTIKKIINHEFLNVTTKNNNTIHNSR